MQKAEPVDIYYHIAVSMDNDNSTPWTDKAGYVWSVGTYGHGLNVTIRNPDGEIEQTFLLTAQEI